MNPTAEASQKSQVPSSDIQVQLPPQDQGVINKSAIPNPSGRPGRNLFRGINKAFVPIGKVANLVGVGVEKPDVSSSESSLENVPPAVPETFNKVFEGEENKLDPVQPKNSSQVSDYVEAIDQSSNQTLNPQEEERPPLVVINSPVQPLEKPPPAPEPPVAVPAESAPVPEPVPDPEPPQTEASLKSTGQVSGDEVLRNLILEASLEEHIRPDGSLDDEFDTVLENPNSQITPEAIDKIKKINPEAGNYLSSLSSRGLLKDDELVSFGLKVITGRQEKIKAA